MSTIFHDTTRLSGESPGETCCVIIRYFQRVWAFLTSFPLHFAPVVNRYLSKVDVVSYLFLLNSTTEISTIVAMDGIYKQTLTFLEQVVNILAVKVPQPKLVVIGNFRAFRYEEQTIHQAIVQKLARMVSTLAATRLLFNNGFVQEQASLQRILDEISEDIQFLAFGVLEGDHKSELHCQYLDAFYQEEFDAETAIRSSQNRQMIPRRKIQAYLDSHIILAVRP